MVFGVKRRWLFLASPSQVWNNLDGGSDVNPNPVGQRIKMTPARLRAQYIGVPDRTVLSICMKDEQIVGHAFATVWEYEGGQHCQVPSFLMSRALKYSGSGVVGWVTQLVVDNAFRRRRVATTILRSFKTHPLFENVSVVGIASSHPAACDVLTKYAGEDHPRSPPGDRTYSFLPQAFMSDPSISVSSVPMQQKSSRRRTSSISSRRKCEAICSKTDQMMVPCRRCSRISSWITRSLWECWSIISHIRVGVSVSCWRVTSFW